METQQAPPAVGVGAKPDFQQAFLQDVHQAGSDQGAATQNITPTSVASTGVHLDPSSRPNNSSSSSRAADTSGAPLQAPPRRVCLEWVDAAKAGDVLELRRLRAAWPSLLNQQVGGLEATAAHWAAANGHTDALQHLLEWGADVMVQTATGCLPLHSAAAAGRAECAQLLMFADPALQQHQLTAVNEDGLTAAALALRHGHRLVQGMLLQAAAACAAGTGQAQEQEEPPTAPQQQAQPVKQAGMRRGFLLGVAAKPEGEPGTRCADMQCSAAIPASAAGAGISEADAPRPAQPDSLWDSTVDNPLFGVACSPVKQEQQQQEHHAAPPQPSRLCAATLATGDTATAVIEGADTAATATAAPDPASAPRDSAAADSGDAAARPMLQQQQQGGDLLQQSAPAAAIDRSVGRAWLDAARAGDLPRLQELLHQEAALLDYRGTGTSYAFVGNSALHWAAAKGHRGCVRWLLQQGAGVGAVNEAGASPLHTAVEHGQPGCAELLVLLGGADVAAQDGYGQRVLSLASAGTGGGSSRRVAGCGVRGEQLLLWDQAYKLQQQDRSAWGNVAMQRFLQLGNKSAEAARCLEKHELVSMAAGELQSMLDRLAAA